MKKHIARMMYMGILAVFLGGCGKGQGASGTRPAGEETVGSQTGSESRIELQEADPLYARFEDAGGEAETKHDVCLVDNSLYYFTNIYDSDRNGHVQHLYIQEQGEEAQLLLSFGEGDGKRLEAMASGEEGLYLLYIDNGGDRDPKTYTMEKWDRERQVAWSIDTTEGMGDNQYIYDMEVGKDGTIYGVTLDGTVLYWDETGGYQGQFTLPENGTTAKGTGMDKDFYLPFGLVNGGDSGVYAYWGGVDQETDYGIHLYDLKVWAEMDEAERETAKPLRADYMSVNQLLVPGSVDVLYVFSGYDDGIYMGDKYRLWRIDTADGSLELLVVWQDVGLAPGYVRGIRRQEDGGFLLYVFDTLEEWNYWVALEPVSDTEQLNKHKLVLGVAGGLAGSQSLTSRIDQVVLSYNRTHPYCQITVREYQQSELTNFQTELLTGDGPDILLEIESFFDMESLMGKGIVEDLTPYLAESEEELLPGILDLVEKDGKTPRIPLSFSVDVMILPEGMGQEVMRPHEIVDYMADSTYIDILVYPYFLTDILSGAEMDHYIDEETKNCSFDSGEFAGLLESLAKLKDKERIGSRQERAELFHSGELRVIVEELPCLKDYLCIREAFSGVGEITGFPNSSGELRYPAKLYDWMGINSATEYKEDAWSFIEFCLSYMSRSDNVEDRFVVTKDKFCQQIRFEQTGSYFIYWNNFDENWIGAQEIEAMAQEETDLLWKISEHLYFYENDDLLTVISEDAGAFFSGYISAREAAERIQNRANLIVNE